MSELSLLLIHDDYVQAIASLKRIESGLESMTNTKDSVADAVGHSGLAGAYREAGRLDEATALHERTLAQRRETLGPDHPSTLASRNNLASAYYAAGRLGEAIPLFEEVLADSLRVLGSDHPDTLTSRRNLEAARRARESGSASARAP